MRLSTKERIAQALADGPLTAEQILERVGIDCIAALRRMLTDGQIEEHDDHYSLTT